MKKQLLLAGITLISIAAHAQPTIQSNEFNYTSSPMFWLEYNAAQSVVAPGVAGANVSWDFSALVVSASTIYTTHACPGESNCSTFPGANQMVDGNGEKIYFNRTATEMSQVGELSGVTLVFTNPMKLLQFPITFNQTFTDAFVASSGSDSKTGTVTSKIDAYGKLKTPNGTYLNVLRQKIVESSVVTAGSLNYNMVVTKYYWIKPGFHHFVMGIVITELSGLPTPVAPSYAVTFTTHQGDDPEDPVGIKDQESLSDQVNVYPNPATKVLNIQSRGVSVHNVCLYNLIGQKILDQAVENSSSNGYSVSLESIQPGAGCYFLKINTDKGQVTKQIIIR